MLVETWRNAQLDAYAEKEIPKGAVAKHPFKKHIVTLWVLSAFLGCPAWV